MSSNEAGKETVLFFSLPPFLLPPPSGYQGRRSPETKLSSVVMGSVILSRPRKFSYFFARPFFDTHAFADAHAHAHRPQPRTYRYPHVPGVYNDTHTPTHLSIPTPTKTLQNNARAHAIILILTPNTNSHTFPDSNARTSAHAHVLSHVAYSRTISEWEVGGHK